ncbi:MAG: cation-translocating P-type ATPase [Phycisphaerales bacterium]|jgi:heavy metal translocating P-type ATPase|nr:cation-translocating P-type ATPase [Phycisphaerales bacterium]
MSEHDQALDPTLLAANDAGLADERSAAGLERRLLVALGGGVLLGTAWIGGLIGINPQISQIPAFLGALILVIPLLAGAWREIASGRPAGDALATLAVLAAMASEMYLAAGFLALFLWAANLVLSRTAWGAQRAIRDLVHLTPDTARRVNSDGSEETVGLSALNKGDMVRVRPGENLPVDGSIIKGESDINQASLTGEAVPVEVGNGAPVYAGTTNLTGQIDIEVTAVEAETTIGKVEELIREAESSRTRRQEIIEQLAGYYFWVVIMVAALVWFFATRSGEETVRAQASLRAITVLVVTCPGGLLISHPTAMVAAFAAAARVGIMIKQTRTLEAAAEVDTVIMDKTGTLTSGIFAVSRLSPAEGVDGATLLQAAADGEQHSNHPLARSILDTATQANITPATLDRYEELHGRGVIAHTEGGDIHAGRAAWLIELDPSISAEVSAVEAKIDGMSGVHVMRAGRYLGAVGLEDALRSNAAEAVSELRELGCRRIAMFTGDRLPVATRVAEAIGIDSVEAECLPEEKHEELKHLMARGHRTMVIGDGINDGPILATADVGVAMGLSGSDIATNSAGVALMNDDLRHIPFLLSLARRTRSVISQNIGVSILLAVIGLALAATGTILTLWLAPFYYALGYVVVIANSLRLVRFGEEFSEAEQSRAMKEQARHRRLEAGEARRARIAATGS